MSRKQVALRFLSATAVLAFLFSVSSSSVAAQAPGTQKQSPSQHRSIPLTKKVAGQKRGPQTADIPYFTLRDGMTSILTLDNSAMTPTAVTIAIFNRAGQGHTLPPITVDRQSVKQLNLAELVPSELFDSGNIQVAYDGLPFEVNCQVSIFSSDKRVDIESRQEEYGHSESNSLGGIVFLPYSETDGFLAVTNVAGNKITAEITLPAATRQIVLSPRETRLVNLRNELGLRTSSPGLVQLKHNGMPGDIVTAGFVLDLEKGYSSTFPMSDPALAGSTTLAGAHFRAGQADPGEGFPLGTSFRAPLFLANVGAAPVAVHVSVDYTVREKLQMTPLDSKQTAATGDKFASISVKDLTVAPGDIQRVELSDELARLGINGPLKEAGVDIAYDGKPGDIIGQLTSVDQTGDYSFDVPIRDVGAKYKYVGGAYPWTLENGTTTTLHLKNGTNKKTYALVQLFFPDGSQYVPQRIWLQPHQTIALDIQELKLSKQPDIQKHPFPENATNGLLWWTEGALNSIVGGAEQLNVSQGLGRGFSAAHSCLCPMQPVATQMSPDTDTESVGTVDTPFTPQEIYGYGDGCSSYETPPYNVGAEGTWTSFQTSVATVDSSSGQVTYDGAGGALIAFDWTEDSYESDGLECYDIGPTGFEDDASANSCDFTITPPQGIVAPKCDDATKNQQNFVVSLTSNSPGSCTINSSQSSCGSISNGNVSIDEANTGWNVSTQQCNMFYFASGTSGNSAGNYRTDISIKFTNSNHPILHTATGPVICK